MTRRTALALLALGLAASSECGKKGPVMAPLVRIPQVVEDLSVSRVGNRVSLRWTSPTATVDGRPLARITEVEVWLVEEPKTSGGPPPKPGRADFEKKGRLLERLPEARLADLVQKGVPRPQPVLTLDLDPTELAQKSLFFSLRVRDEKKRRSEFSEPAGIPAAPALSPPREVRAEVFADHIELRWQPPSAPEGAAVSAVGGFNVYRSEGEAVPVRLNSEPLKASEYRDSSFTFGKVYRYFVRSASAAAPATVESEDSEIITVDAVDRFPPAAPRGLTIISGQGFVALSWEPAREADLAGYRVWRREAGQAQWTMVMELPPAESSFTDTTVEKNKRYVYAITAFDRAGNESEKSEEAAGLSRRSGG
jgi:hypothetical protein